MKTSIRTDTKLWRFWEAQSGGTTGEIPPNGGIYVFGYTWFEARGGALAAFQVSSALLSGHEIRNLKDHLVEEGSTIVFVDRGSTWFEIVETLRRMSGEEARKLLAFPAFGGASPFEPDSSMEGGPDEAVVDCVVEENMPIRTSTRKLESSLTRASVAESIADDAIRELVSLRAVVGAARYWVRNFPKGVPVAVGPDTDLIDAVRAYEDETPNLTPAEVELKAYHDRLEETVRRLQGELEAKELERFRAARQAEEYRVMGKAQEKELIETRRQARLVPADAGILCNCDEFKKRLLVASETEKRLTMEKDAAYEERNRLVALFASMALALGWKAGVGQHEDEPGKEWDADWRTLIMVETPEGQASWHFHDSQNHLVKHLPSYVAKWDGHDTPTKYARLERLMRRASSATHQLVSGDLGAGAVVLEDPVVCRECHQFDRQVVCCECVIEMCKEARLDEQRIAALAPTMTDVAASYLQRAKRAEAALGHDRVYWMDRAEKNAAELERMRVEKLSESEVKVEANGFAGTWRVHVGGAWVWSFSGPVDANAMAEKLRFALGSKTEPLRDQDMTRNPTTEEELARVRSELNHYRDKYLNDDRIPIANAEIIRLGREILRLLENIDRMRVVVDAAVAHVDAETMDAVNATIDVLGDAVRAYLGSDAGAPSGPAGLAPPQAGSSVVVRLEAAPGGFQAVVASPGLASSQAGFVMMSAMDTQDDAQFYVDSANKALVPFLHAEYRRGLLKGAQECLAVAAEHDREAKTSASAGSKDSSVRYRTKKDAAEECARLIEALAKAAT